MSHKRKISVIGLGYVGLPAAAAFARSAVPVVGYDIDERRIAELARGHDRTGEVEPAGLTAASLRFFSLGKRPRGRGLPHRDGADADPRQQAAQP